MSWNCSSCSRNGLIVLCALGVAFVTHGFVAGQASQQLAAQSGLEKRMADFISAFDSLPPERFVSFFPKSDDFTYTRTVHGDGGGVRKWRFPATQAGEALAGSDRPLWASFTVQFEAQPIGLFAHQVLERPGRWVRIYGTRYVPPGSGAASPIYVEWRREGAEWVISEFGDEIFPHSVPLPRWCCSSPG